MIAGMKSSWKGARISELESLVRTQSEQIANQKKNCRRSQLEDESDIDQSGHGHHCNTSRNWNDDYALCFDDCDKCSLFNRSI